uniref:JmjC domain-containing protein n=1 Tax=Alexandrium catenella TaxID=2925 RepID=A0A7S1L046_ALECA
MRSFLREALLEHAAKTGYPLTEEDKRSVHVVMWAAVYLNDGGRHGYHVHQSSLSSCVFYAKAPPGKTPIMFVDPRGAPPTHDYEQHLGEHDFEPVAPFHHNYHFFAEAGDLVCFPSWLVHRVPSHFEEEPRVAFPANLQSNAAWDAWYRSATLP